MLGLISPGGTRSFGLSSSTEGAYGVEFSRRTKGLGIREVKTAVEAPLMNAYCERLIGTLRRECFDHVIVLNERHASLTALSFAGPYGRKKKC